MPKWNTGNNDVARTANFITTIRDTLAGLGIEISDVCDPEGISEGLKKIWDKWIKDVKRTLDNISFKITGNFFTTLASLLAQVFSEAAAAYSNIFFLEIIAGNIINSLVSATVFVLAITPGAEIILQYYLVTNLKRDLERRRQLSWILYTQFDQLIGLFSSFYAMFKFEDDFLSLNLKRALRNIRQAESIIGREVSKNFYGGEPVKIEGLTTADFHLEAAIKNLTHHGLGVVYDYILRINEEYGITANVPSGLDITGLNIIGSDITEWKKYFQNLQPFIAFNFFTYTSTPGTREYENEVKTKSARYNQFISAMMQVFPPILQRIILQATFKNASDVIFERMPIWTNNFKALNDTKRFIDNSITVPDKFMNTFLNISRPPTPPKPALFQNPATKDITWRNITAKIRISEAGTLLFPSYWEYIKHTGGLLQKILFPILNILKKVDSEIDGVLQSNEKPGFAEMSVNQFKWIEELILSRGMLSTILNTQSLSSQYGNIPLNPVQIYNATVQSDIYMTELQSFIKEKSYDSVKKEAKIVPADVVYDTAQKYLAALMTNIYIIVNPAATKNLISGMQAIKVALMQQVSLDKQEINYCSRFLNSVQVNPVFIAVKPYLDKLLNDLLHSKVGSGIAKQLLEGDLSSIVTILEGYHAVDEVVSLINCENAHTDGNIDPSALGLSADINQETIKEVQGSVEKLRDTQQQLAAITTSMTELIAELPA